MADRISKTQRWLDLIAFLVGRRFPVPVDEIMEGVPAYARRWTDGSETDRASVRRTFERDKDELRAFGIPIETIEYSINYGQERTEGYRIERKDFYLPYLRLVEEARADPETQGGRSPEPPAPSQEVSLDEEEARAALDAVRRVVGLPGFPLKREARSAFRKLSFDLDPERFQEAPVRYLEPPGTDELLDTVRELSDALQNRKRARFRYYGIHRDRTTDRSVLPYGLLFQHGHWYLVGRDEDRQDLRVFRVGRIQSLEVNTSRPGTPDFEVPGEFSLEAYRDRSAWELGEDERALQARVRFPFPRSLWAERNRLGELETQESDGAQIRRFSVIQSGPFLRWLLSLGGEAELLGPGELRDELSAMVGEIVRRHEDSSPPPSTDGPE